MQILRLLSPFYPLFPLLGLALSACSSNSGDNQVTDAMVADPGKPFGTAADAGYATSLWQAMSAASLTGQSRVMSHAYTGAAPHGMILDTYEVPAFRLADNRGVLIIKNNYGGDGLTTSDVMNDPEQYLQAVTVMYKRPGYDPDNQDWFYAKYNPDGSLQSNPKGMLLAGRVAKGMPTGCIACHAAAPGNDFVFGHDRYASQ